MANFDDIVEQEVEKFLRDLIRRGGDVLLNDIFNDNPLRPHRPYGDDRRNIPPRSLAILELEQDLARWGKDVLAIENHYERGEALLDMRGWLDDVAHGRNWDSSRGDGLTRNDHIFVHQHFDRIYDSYLNNDNPARRQHLDEVLQLTLDANQAAINTINSKDPRSIRDYQNWVQKVANGQDWDKTRGDHLRGPAHQFVNKHLDAILDHYGVYYHSGLMQERSFEVVDTQEIGRPPESVVAQEHVTKLKALA